MSSGRSPIARDDPQSTTRTYSDDVELQYERTESELVRITPETTLRHKWQDKAQAAEESVEALHTVIEESSLVALARSESGEKEVLVATQAALKLADKAKAGINSGELALSPRGTTLVASPRGARNRIALVVLLIAAVAAGAVVAWLVLRHNGTLPPSPPPASACPTNVTVPVSTVVLNCQELDAEPHRRACHWWESTCASGDPNCCKESMHHQFGDCEGFGETLCVSLMGDGCCCWDPWARACSSPFRGDCGDSDFSDCP